MRTVTKRGHADWDDLLGKEISLDWSDGWDDYWIHGAFEGVQVYAEDPGTPDTTFFLTVEAFPSGRLRK